eukprot:PLAT8687.2.p1 GENE.PLAT8687.2~~PLAT8687.2.p1  ORF type:complete len:673 (+),score=265.79 PLAT8687.2:259-2019(+)
MVERASGKVEALKEELPPLRAACDSVRATADLIRQRHARNRRTLLQHTSLIELLEVPQLMETCVRNGLFEEALQLAAFANTLRSRHRVALAAAAADESEAASGSSGSEGDVALDPTAEDGAAVAGRGVDIIRSLISDVQRSVRQMREQLLAQLRSNLQVTVCVRTMSYIRKLDRIARSWASEASDGAGDSEESDGAAGSDDHDELLSSSDSLALLRLDAESYELALRRQFLQCREAWMQAEQAELPRRTNSKYLEKLVEHERHVLFQVISQFNALFTSDGPDPQLYHWAARHMHGFLATLARMLPSVTDASTLAGIMSNSEKMAASMGRVGCDFSPLLAPLFEAQLVRWMRSLWHEASGAFAMALLSSQFLHYVPKSKTRVTAASSSGDGSAGSAASASGEFAPSHDLLQFPALAQLTNGFLSSFNELRLCALQSASTALASVMREELQRVCAAVTRVWETRVQPAAEAEDGSGAEELLHWQQMAQLLTTSALPLLSNCFHAVLGRRPPELLSVDDIACKVRTIWLGEEVAAADEGKEKEAEKTEAGEEAEAAAEETEAVVAEAEAEAEAEAAFPAATAAAEASDA